FQAEDGIRAYKVTSSDVCSSDLLDFWNSGMTSLWLTSTDPQFSAATAGLALAPIRPPTMSILMALVRSNTSFVAMISSERGRGRSDEGRVGQESRSRSSVGGVCT